MKKKKKKVKYKNLLITFPVLLLTIILILTQNNSFDYKLKRLIKEVNNVNELFDKIDYNDPTKYVTRSGLICYKSDDGYIDKIKEIYSSPFFENGNFNLVYSGEKKEKKLYICVKENCEVKKIKSYKVKKTIDLAEVGDSIAEPYKEENMKIITIFGKDYNLIKKDDNWQFQYPIVICK